MNNSEEILNELRSISPLLASAEKINVFQAPSGYFDDLHFRITKFTIANISPVENIARINLQQVPEGYFDNLSNSILAKIKAIYPESAEEELEQLPEILQSLKNINPFSVPSGYFDELNHSVLNKIINQNGSAEEELQHLSPLLFSLKDINVFSVPENYFSTLNESIVEKVKPAPAKVITMKKRNTWFNYAAAAVITGAITITSLRIFNNSDTKSPVLPSYIQESFQYKTEADVDAAIAKLDDADIAKYLEKNGNVMDNELLINNTDESELPDPNDYLIDDNTLSNYLNKINDNNATN